MVCVSRVTGACYERRHNYCKGGQESSSGQTLDMNPQYMSMAICTTALCIHCKPFHAKYADGGLGRFPEVPAAAAFSSPAVLVDLSSVAAPRLMSGNSTNDPPA